MNIGKQSRKPQNIGKHDWYYERPNNLLLIHEVRDLYGAYIRTDQIKIPWRLILKSVQRLRPTKKTIGMI